MLSVAKLKKHNKKKRDTTIINATTQARTIINEYDIIAGRLRYALYA